jgi:acylphosphatase
MIKHYEIQVFGRVQGVWFRKYTQQTAQALSLSGWVRNEADGSVRISVEGPEEQLETFLDWCHEGSPESEVDRVHVEESTVQDWTGFEISR